MFRLIKYSIAWILLMWIVAIWDFFLIDLNGYGIRPREPMGLIGIITSPFLHADLSQYPSHIINNTVFLMFLLPITLFFYPKTGKKILWLVILMGGILVWIFGRANNHIGASGMIFGLITFLLFSGIFRHNIKAILSSIIFLLLYGIIIYGIIPQRWSDFWMVFKYFLINFISGVSPQKSFISWEGHLFGAISGFLMAYIYRKEKN